MIELHADDWYTATGRGTIATVGVEQVTEPVNVGDRVIIDSKQYEVRGIEVKRGLTDPPVILGYGFVVRPWPCPMTSCRRLPGLAFAISMLRGLLT